MLKNRLYEIRNIGILTMVIVTMVACKSLEEPQQSNEMKREEINYRDVHVSAESMGQMRFLFDSMGSLSIASLETAILPWKIYSAALLTHEEFKTGKPQSIENLSVIMQRDGFIPAEKARIANWSDGKMQAPEMQGSIGLIHADASATVKVGPIEKKIAVQTGGISCASCHSGVTYNDKGLPQFNVWLGAPNSSINFEGFTQRIYFALEFVTKNEGLYKKKILELYPDFSDLEQKTFEEFVWPKLKSEVRKLSKMQRAVPYSNGSPGVVNGTAKFKKDSGLLKDVYSYHKEEASFISIPMISDRTFKSSFSSDGVYSLNGTQRFKEINAVESEDPKRILDLSKMLVYFNYTAISTLLKNVEAQIPKVTEVLTWLKDVRPPNFPVDLDKEKGVSSEKMKGLLNYGAVVYSQSCASCHGVYKEIDGKPVLVKFPNKLISGDKIKTDPIRYQAINKPVIEYANRTPEISKYISVQAANGYVAPILTGLWLTAPYLHNGSVRSIWELMNPELRAKKFKVGGHALDLENLGIAYPENYIPWSEPVEYDTSELGKSNAGHEEPFISLSIGDKKALLHYLKSL